MGYFDQQYLNARILELLGGPDRAQIDLVYSSDKSSRSPGIEFQSEDAKSASLPTSDRGDFWAYCNRLRS